MTHSTPSMFPFTVGLDVGDRRTHFAVVDVARNVTKRGSMKTDRAELQEALAPFAGAKVILEAGSQSPWMSRMLRARGHTVQVVDPRRVQLISKDPRKTDRRDAEMLAKLGAAMPEMLGEIHHRGELAQSDLSLLRVRDLLVRMRTMAVQQVRGICKAFGVKLPKSSTEAFARAMTDLIPDLLRPAAEPMLVTIAFMTDQIHALEKQLVRVAKTRYPEIAHLQQLPGVGPIVAAAFVLSIEDPKRFTKSRRVGSWIGLCPRVQSSGDSNPQLRISKAGDPKLRRLLVQAARYVLGPFGPDCDLRRYGLRIAERGGKAARKRAAVAVARKLAVLMHRLWVTRADYVPLRSATAAQTLVKA